MAIGIDLRPSSPAIATACASSIQREGFNIDYCGALPTPALAFYAQQEKIPAIMVTGSHIPFDRNGIKFYRPDGEISKVDETAILNTQIPDQQSIDQFNLPEVNTKAIALYEQRYIDFFGLNLLNGLRVGVYEHSSVARDLLRRLLITLGAEVITLERTDNFVPIDTEAVGHEDILKGIRWSKEYGLDAIISTDGDADRPLIGDENGQWLRGDIVGLLTARYLKIKQIATPVSSNSAIEMSGIFDRVLRTRIGSPYVIEGMMQFLPNEGSIAGFEANGGFLLGSPIMNPVKHLEALPTRDALLPILAVLAEAQQLNCTISKLVHSLPKRYTDSDRLQNFPSAISRKLLETWSGDLDEFARLFGIATCDISGSDNTDGLRITFKDQSIIHLRPSGNAPEFRCYTEAESPNKASALLQRMIDILNLNYPSS